jgi:hypothetical protein
MKAKAISIVILSAALLWFVPKVDTPVKNLEPKAAAGVVTTTNGTAGQSASLLTAKTTAEASNMQTAAPATETPEVQPVKQVPQGCAAYVPLLKQYDWDINVMAAVMQAESNCNPNAASPPNYDGLRDYGLMQLHGQDIYDPATNVAHAYAIWQRQGYHAWSTYNNGAYLRYL